KYIVMKIRGYEINLIRTALIGIAIFILSRVIGYFIVGDREYLSYWYGILDTILFFIFLILVVRGKFGAIKKVRK
ncbi:MAG: hypothetical protein QMD97_04390, partial [Candidatus Aenigmarchaeota archaeon]|nr:hypothetical protein [Candidatus Aenigmarchaeota archaeon]